MDPQREEALRWVRRKRTFYLILGIWLALCLMWFLIDIIPDSNLDWFWWPMMGTGIFVAISGVILVGMGNMFGPDWERRQVDRYMERRRPPGDGSGT
jgi:2TM domain